MTSPHDSEPVDSDDAPEPLSPERASALARLLSDADSAENELNGRSPDAAREFDAIMENLSRFVADSADPQDPD